MMSRALGPTPLTQSGIHENHRVMFHLAGPKELRLIETLSLGADIGRGNLLGIQPYFEIPDYASEESFTRKLDGYFQEAHRLGWIKERTVVVLPEFVATWLVAAGEWSWVRKAPIAELAMVGVILKNFKTFLHYVRNAKGADRIKYALFRTKAKNTLDIYVSAFRSLATRYQVTIVAGSVVLPKLKKVSDAEWQIASDELYNTTLLFYPDGKVDERPVLKVYPTPQELPFTTPGPIGALPIYDTPAGRLAVLNCADSWYPDTYKFLSEQGGYDVLAVPSFVEKDRDTELPWRGNNITPPPPEFDSKDFFKITYDDAWMKYALGGRFKSNQVKNAVNVFLRGRFWNMGSDGRSILIQNGKLHRGVRGVGAALQNVWVQ